MPETHIDSAALAHLVRAMAAISPREMLAYSAATALARLRFQSDAAGALAYVRDSASCVRLTGGSEDVGDVLDAFAEAAEALAGGDILSACELLSGVLDADVALAESAVSKFEAAWQEALH